MILAQISIISSGGGSEANPSELFGEDLKLWINTDSSNNKTLSDAQGSLPAISVDSLISDDATGYAFGSGTNETFNGFALGTKGSGLFHNVSLTNFKNLHDGSAFTFLFKVFILEAEDTERFPLFQTANIISSDIGLWCYYDNRIAFSRTDALVVAISRGIGGELPINFSVNNVLTRGEWHTVELSYTGSQMTAYVDGAQVAQQINQFDNSTANQSRNFTIFRQAGLSEYARDTFIRHPLIVTRVITADERTSLNMFLDSTNDTFGSGDDANVYGMHGQSNMLGGTADYTGDPAYFDDPTGALIYNNTHAASTYVTNKFVPHQFGVMSNTDNQNAPGPDVEFAYRMNLIAPDSIFLLKLAISATSIVSSASVDWNAAGGATDGATLAFDQQLVYGLRLLKYHYNRNVTLRGFLWRQGESDTTEPNAYYEQDFIDLINDRFVATAEAQGFSVAKCRLVVSSLDCYVATRGQGAQNIVDQCQNVCNNAATHFGFAGGHQFSTIGFGIQADGTHFNTAGQISQGFAFYDYLKDFINE